MRKNVMFTTGAFLATVCALLFATSVVAQGVTHQTINLSYSQVTRGLTEIIPMSRSTDVDGLPRYSGQAPDSPAVLEVDGHENDVWQATLMVYMQTGSLTKSTKLLVRFMKNVAPEWPSASDWATKAVARSKSTGEEEQTVRGNKLFKVSYMEELGGPLITVKHK